MKKYKNETLCFTIIIILSILNLFTKPVADFLIGLFSHSIQLKTLYITAKALNFTYLGLILVTISYFFIYKKGN